jgi:hypothetical protein
MTPHLPFCFESPYVPMWLTCLFLYNNIKLINLIFHLNPLLKLLELELGFLILWFWITWGREQKLMDGGTSIGDNKGKLCMFKWGGWLDMTLMLNCNESFFDFPKSNFDFIVHIKVLRNLANLFNYHKDKCMVRWTTFGVIVIVFLYWMWLQLLHFIVYVRFVIKDSFRI